MSDTIGVIGLGNAGSSLCKALSGRVPLIGFDLSEVRRDAVSGLDIACVASAADVAAKAGRIILSLPKPEASLAVVDEILAAGHRPEIVIETSTVTPKTAIDAHKRCKAVGVGFVDAAIAGGVASMASAKITFFLGGDSEDVAKARPVLDLLAERIFELGPIGAGMGAKVVNNGVMHAVMVVLIEAFAMSTKLGVPIQTMIDILNREEGLMRPLVHRVQERMVQGDYNAGMSVSNARKDSVLALETAQQLGVPLFATLAAHTPYEIAEAKGMGDLDYAALARLWEDWSAVSFQNG
ncbi:3-hydroxyisobutyrate dehydrogenase [alpha proteobacterium BAL199]|jgi:3-hydroxyisobutyrate dehydrogenase|nr:3-hydroxyisobutyrate dehydrogenase [alpha proteobacterium BAL199]